MKLLPIDSIRPSTYNPRTADETRLALIELSLRKLGFLLPIYATPEGEILSGHQRHLVAQRMGLTHVPVETTKSLNIHQRHGINILFNRATNDLEQTTTSESMTKLLLGRNLHEMAETLPDKTDHYPCLSAVDVSTDELVQANSGRWNDYARNVSTSLARQRIYMPIIVQKSTLKVINGIGRLEVLAGRKKKTVPVVFVSDEESVFSDSMLNYLSMDFDVHGRYADILRYNSFRRYSTMRYSKFLGEGMLTPLKVNSTTSGFSLEHIENRDIFTRQYGNHILDFGAGFRYNTEYMCGIDCDAFEPYPLRDTDMPDKELSHEINSRFLKLVGQGKRWSSIFLQSVLNSVPFHEDRRCVLSLVAALSDVHTAVHISTQSTKSGRIKNATGKSVALNYQSETRTFLLTYEPNVILGDLTDKPKMQKYFDEAELHALVGEWFGKVKTIKNSGYIFIECRNPRPVSRAFLRKAVELEFDLPYPDGSRLGLVEQALTAFSSRLGVKL